MIIEKETSPIWDQFKEDLFCKQYKDSFNFEGNSIGEKINCFFSYVLNNEEEKIGCGLVFRIFEEFDGEQNEYYEIHLAIDKKHIQLGKGYGTSLLNAMEDDIRNSDLHSIVATIKSTNENKFFNIELFIKKDYKSPELNANKSKVNREKFIRDIGNIMDFTLYKDISKNGI